MNNLKSKTMKQLLDLNDLLTEQLREIYDAEIHLTPFLDELANQVHHLSLYDLIVQYNSQTSDNHWVLKQVFNNLFTQKRGEKSSAVRQMMKDLSVITQKCRTVEIKEASIILGLQHIIHYKIATYGALCTYAKILSLYEDASRLHDLLAAEKILDRKLAMLADEDIYRNENQLFQSGGLLFCQS